MGRQRSAYWDNVKAVLIFLVVLGHFLYSVDPRGRVMQAVYNWIYLFHMPAFVFVSGFFAKRYVISERKEYKLAGYLAAYLVYMLYIWLILFIFTRSIPVKDLLKTHRAPWFMMALFIWHLLIPFVSRLKPVISIPLAFALALYSGTFKECGLFLTLSRVFSMFPFFLVGYYYQPKKLEKRHTGLKIAAGLILLVCGLILYFHGRELDRFLKVMYGSKSYQALHLSMSEGVLFRSAWFCAAFLMTAALLYVVPDRRCRFTYIGERTLGVYLLHRLPRDLIKNLGLSRLIGGSSRALLFYVILSAAIILICSVKPADDACRRMFHLDCIMKRTPPAPEPAEPGK